MIQRFVHTVLKTALAAIKDDPTLLDKLFRDELELEVEEVAAIKTFFAAQPPNVIMGYPRQDSAFPLYAIIMGSEGEKTNFIGDDGHTVGDFDEEAGDPDIGEERIAAMWQHAFLVHCYTEHPDATSYIYEVAKFALFANANNFFTAKGLSGISISGMDLAPDARYVPEHLFLRQLTFRADKEFNLPNPRSKIGKAFKVAGIHVDNSGSPSDVGGVKTKITMSTKDEADDE